LKLIIPELSLVILIGTSGSGKSTFARHHFLSTEVLSSDFCRGLVRDDENDQDSSNDAFDVLHFIASKRLAAGKLTVVDATNVQVEARKPLIDLARKYHCIPVAIVFDIPEKICQERNKNRPDRNFGPHVIRRQNQDMRRSIKKLKREGFRHIYILSSPEEVESVKIERQLLWNNRKQEHGPFDIIGDIHGCFDELLALLEQLGYEVKNNNTDLGISVSHPEGRKLLFLGDLVDRGPKITETLKLAMNMYRSGTGLCVPGNHDKKLCKALQGKNVQLNHGLANSMEQLARESEEFKNQVFEFLDKLVSHYIFDGGKLVIAHAGMKEEMQGRGSGKVREFALYGETTGETDEFGLPIRYNWAADYRGKAIVVYGHTPITEPEWLNRTICIDTGCVFGGKLTALRYPEKELVSVPALQKYYEPAKPLTIEDSSLHKSSRPDDLLDISDVFGKRSIPTKLHHRITIREENSRAALEVMSRFAVNPKWLIYLPPTMSPSETSKKTEFLEYPSEAFSYYQKNGIEKVICEQKHMGSRAIVIICKDGKTAEKRFKISDGESSICYTRTGRRFFDDRKLEIEFLNRVRNAIEKSGIWEELQTDLICLDCELMPWSVKAQELLRQQYAPVGASSKASLAEAVEVLKRTNNRGIEVTQLLQRFNEKLELAKKFSIVYGNYCWPVNSIKDLKLAPFHILATENSVHSNKDHVWHMETISRISREDEELLLATPYIVVNLNDLTSIENGVAWWEELTSADGEGMVIKPYNFIATHKGNLIQPAIKCRGREYLRIIYGIEYTLPEHLERLRSRGLSTKRNLALKEFALGIEALERFVNNEPIYRIHECVFGVLAMESEPVDPRL
jgi:protein phosphatase